MLPQLHGAAPADRMRQRRRVGRRCTNIRGRCNIRESPTSHLHEPPFYQLSPLDRPLYGFCCLVRDTADRAFLFAKTVILNNKLNCTFLFCQKLRAVRYDSALCSFAVTILNDAQRCNNSWPAVSMAAVPTVLETNDHHPRDGRQAAQGL